MPEPLEREALNELLALTGGDAMLFVELLDTFLSDADQYLGELDAAVAAGDHAALQRPAHSLKSNALNVGATRLAELPAGYPDRLRRIILSSSDPLMRASGSER